MPHDCKSCYSGIKGAKRRLDAQVVRECAYGRGIPMNRLDLMPKRESSIDYGGTNPPNEPFYPVRPATAGALAFAMGDRGDFNDSFFTSLRHGAPAVKPIPVRGQGGVGRNLVNPAANITGVQAASFSERAKARAEAADIIKEITDKTLFNMVFPTGSSRIELDENTTDAVESELGITLPDPVPDEVYFSTEERDEMAESGMLDLEPELETVQEGLPDPSQPVIDESEILRQPYQAVPEEFFGEGGGYDIEPQEGGYTFKELVKRFGLSKTAAKKIMKKHRGGTPIRPAEIKAEMDKVKMKMGLEVSKLLEKGVPEEIVEQVAKSKIKTGKDEYSKIKRAEKESRAGSSRDIPERIRVKPTPADIEKARSSLETFAE